MNKEAYQQQLYELQVQLVKLQNHSIRHDQQILVIFEGRDAAGKDGTIKRIVQHLSPRETRVVALAKPSARDNSSWYFQRWVAHFPAGGEMVFFNRSWYNRAGVEPVMGFCSADDYGCFMEAVLPFEQLVMQSGIRLIKYYLDISKKEQKTRLEERRNDPLTQWKISPLDEQAQTLWSKYSKARDKMLRRTGSEQSPWFLVHADNKHKTRINVIKHLLAQFSYPGQKRDLLDFDPAQIIRLDGKPEGAD
ncbi:MAG: polyphosphate kinase 2 [Porticoccaceae bacterium]